MSMPGNLWASRSSICALAPTTDPLTVLVRSLSCFIAAANDMCEPPGMSLKFWLRLTLAIWSSIQPALPIARSRPLR